MLNMPVKKKAAKAKTKSSPKAKPSTEGVTQDLTEPEVQVKVEGAPTQAEEVGHPQVSMETEEVKPQTASTNTPPVRVEVEVESETPVQSSAEATKPTTEENVVGSFTGESQKETTDPVGVSHDFAPAAGGVEFSTNSGRSKKWLTIIVLLIIAGGLLYGGVMVYQKAMGGSANPSPTPMATVLPTATPTSSPSASLKRSDLKIQVLNGTETTGYAGKAKAYLEGLGYKNVVVGNAETTDFEETEIAIKDDKKDYASLLDQDLSKNYVVSETIKALDAASSYDVIVTLGKSIPSQ